MCKDFEVIKEYMQNKIPYDINATVAIGGRTYTFSQQQVPEMPLSMALPDNMIRMNQYSIKIKYPYENRPDVILTVSDDETVNFLFTQIKENVAEEDLSDVSLGIQAVLKRMHSEAIFYQMGKVSSQLSDIWWFDYSTAALDDDIYNIMYVLCLDSALLISGFCCLRKYRKQWKPLVLQMLNTIMGQEEWKNESKL